VAELRAWRVTDPAAWNAFVEAAPYHAFTQLWEWGEVRAMGGWRPVRLAIGPSHDEPVAGAQLLLRQIPLLGWHLAYVPRGPVGQLDESDIRDGLLRALRTLGREERIATVRADPEAEPSTPYGRALLDAPWRSAPKVQPPTTRVIDLTAGEDALRADLKRKHRQYVNKAERGGVTIERFDGSTHSEVIGPALDDFNRIYRSTAERAGFVARQPFYYERVWSLFAPTGRVRLAFAVLDGERVATIYHFTCGDRAVEAYGGMTDAGADARANYLLKWDAIAGFAREGFAVYDLWGLATGGIRQFKEGFGGREIEYVGARDLPLRAPIDAALRIAIPTYGFAQRARLRLAGRSPGEAAENA
jgi:lipid II:glycine glycyltransferase (peptidoglycan interpeptide bridge formation enzyme)